jgi:type I restriction enzyme S subunit
MANNWTKLQFGDLLVNGTRNGIYKTKDFHGTGVKIVNMGELFAYPRLKNVEMRRVTLTERELSNFLLEPGDLLFARRSLVAEGAGKCAIVMEVGEHTTFESSIIRARPNPNKSDSLFLFYFFNSPHGKYLLDTIRRQVAVSGITGTDLVRLNIPVPPLDEQRAIAHVLGTLDDKIELNRHMNETLEAIARAIFKSWFIDFDPVRAKAEGKQPFGMDEETAALFPSEFEDSELGEIPKGWAIKTIGEMCDVVGGSTPSTKEPSYWGNDHFFVTPKDMSSLKSPFILSSERQITNEGLKRISSGLLPVGTVLLSSRAPIGYLAIAEVPVSVNQGIIAMIPNGKLPSSYLLFWTEASMDAILCNANGSTFQEISKSNFRPISMVVPPKEIVSRFNAFVEPLLVRVVNNMKESLTLAALRDTLLPKLLSGEIRVPVEAD